MKKFALLLGAFLLASTLPVTAQAENELKPVMKTMGKSFSAAEKSNDLAVIRKELAAMRESALKSQKLVPEHLAKQPADSADRKYYAEGIEKLVTQIDGAIAAAEAGKLDETRAALASIKSSRSQYHKRLKP